MDANKGHGLAIVLALVGTFQSLRSLRRCSPCGLGPSTHFSKIWELFMQVFLSWSGERSYAVADALRTWLPRVLQSVKPWMSAADISAGSRWLAEVSGKLDGSQIGIICVTPENLNSPWLHFEAGALSKALDQSRVCPVAFELTPGQISGPLSQFQAVPLDQVGIKKVLAALNSELGDKALPDTELDEIQSVWWPKLSERLAAIPAAPAPRQARQVDDQLEELLQISREQLRRENLRLEASQARDQKIDGMLKMLDRTMSSVSPLRTSLAGYQDNMKSALQTVIDSMANLNPEHIEDPKQLAAVFSSMMSAFPSAPTIEFDTQPMVELTASLKHFQEEDKQRTEKMLGSPDSQQDLPS